MGKFQSGVWIIGLLIYFISLFIIISSVVIAANEYGISTAASFADPGFGSYSGNMSTPDTASAADTADMSGIKTTLSIITGIGASDIILGVPAAFVYIFSFLFFWLEFVMLIWALYMSIPFFH